VVNTNRHISFFSFANFSDKENILFFLHLALAFLLKTLGTQFAPPHFYFAPFTLKTKPINYQHNFNTLIQQSKLQYFTIILY